MAWSFFAYGPSKLRLYQLRYLQQPGADPPSERLLGKGERLRGKQGLRYHLTAVGFEKKK